MKTRGGGIIREMMIEARTDERGRGRGEPGGSTRGRCRGIDQKGGAGGWTKREARKQ